MNKILVVDDELVIRKGIKKMVEKFPQKKLDVYVASSGLEALRLLDEYHIQLVLTDIRMPKMDGLELAEHISLDYPEVSVVIISGYDDFSYAKKALTFGVREYLLKPVLPEDIFKVLEKLIEEYEESPNQFTLAAYEEWMDRLEEVLWKLEKARLAELLEEWEDLCRHFGKRGVQLAHLLKDCLANIKKRMEKRSFYAQVKLPEEMENLPFHDMMKAFSQQIIGMAEQLANLRGANLKNPFEEAKMFIDSHLAEEITLEEVAERAGMSSTYFSHLFKKETNETFVQYRIRKRMEKAKELMELPHYRIIDICHEVGYNDYPHFTKTFKKYFGHSPSEYRENLGIS